MEQANHSHIAPPRRRRRLHALWMTLLLVIGIVFGATNTQIGRDQVRAFAEGQVNGLLQGARLDIGRLEGNLLAGLEAEDVRLLTTDGQEMMGLDHVRTDYRLWPLLRSHLVLDVLHLDGLNVRAAQRADSTWDWAGLLAPSEGESAWTIDIDTLSVNGVSARALFRSGHRDSTLLIHDMNTAMAGFRMTPDGEFVLRRAALSGAFQPPVRPDTVRLSLDASYAEGIVRLDALSLQSDRSHVSGVGSLDVRALPTLAFQPSTDLQPDSSTFLLRAQPLSFSDVAPFVSGLRAETDVQVVVDVRKDGSTTRLNADVRRRGGGRLGADLEWTQASDGSRMAGTVDIENLDPDRFIYRLSGSTPLSAHLELDLQGPSSDSLSGALSARMEAGIIDARSFSEGTFDEWVFGATELDLTMDSGNAAATISTALQGTRLDARISGRWLDAVPTLAVDGQLRELDIAAWAAPEGLSSSVAASFEGSFRGTDPGTVQGELDVDLLPSRVGGVDSVAVATTMTLANGELTWMLDGRAGSGTLDSEGRLLVVDTPVLESTRTRINDLDLAAFLSDEGTTPSSVSVRLSGQASIEDWQSGRGDLQFEVDSTHWGNFDLSHATGAVSWAAGRGSVGLEALPTDTSSIVIAANVRGRGPRIRIETSELAWRQVDLGSMTSLDIMEASLDGSGSLLVELGADGLDQLDLTLQGAASRWGEQRVEALEIDVEADARELNATVTGAFATIGRDATGASEWRIQAGLQEWRSDSIDARVDIQFEQLDPMAFVGLSDPGTALSGRARATGSIVDGMPGGGAFELEITPSRLRGEPVARARLEGSLQDSTVTAEALLSVAEGRFAGDVTIEPFAQTPSFRSQGSVDGLNVLPLLGRPDLDSDVNLTWEASGTSFDPGHADWRLEVSGQTSRLDSLLMEDLNLAVSWNGRVLDIADLSSRFNSGDLQINGLLNLDPDRSDVYSDLRATWYIGDLNVIERLLELDRLASKSGMVDLQVFGPAGQLDAEMLVSLSDLQVDTWQISSVEASSWITLDNELLPVSTSANVDIGYVALPTLAVRTTSLQVDQRGEVFSIDGDVMVDRGNRLAWSVLVNPFSARPWATMQELDLMLGGEAFALEREASLLIQDGWQLNRLALTSGEQSLALSGGLNDSTGYAARIDMTAFDIAPVGALAGFTDLEGRLGGQVLVSGPPEAPLIDSNIDLELIQNQRELARLLADMQSTPDGLRVDATVAMQDSEDFNVQGFLPVFASMGTDPEERADRTADLNLSIQTAGGSIRWVAPFLDPTLVTDIEGLATADIQVSGSINDPRLEGFLNLEGARFRLPEYGVTYRMDQFRSTLQDVTIRVEQARLRSGDGEIDIAGSIDFASLTNSSFDLTAELDRFRAVRNDELHTTLSGSLVLTGRTTRPDLTGQLTTQNTSYWLTETAGGDIEQVALSFEDEVMLADNFGYRAVAADTLAAAIWTGLSMDLSVVLERDTWIRQRVNPEMAIELSGRVDLQKDRGQEDLNIYRSIEVVPDRSTIKQFGRNFRIVEGLAQFNGPVEEMVLQVEAEYEVPSRLNPGQPEVVITLRLDGRLDDLEFDLSSDPAMENTDIVSYIATGRPASESLQFGDSSINNQVLVGVAASQLAGLVEGVASQSLGLDVVSIEQDGLKGTRLTAGKYVTPRLFVGVTQPFSFSGGSNVVVDEERELTLEYKVFEYLLLQLLADASDSPVRVNIAGRYSY